MTKLVVFSSTLLVFFGTACRSRNTDGNGAKSTLDSVSMGHSYGSDEDRIKSKETQQDLWCAAGVAPSNERIVPMDKGMTVSCDYGLEGRVENNTPILGLHVWIPEQPSRAKTIELAQGEMTGYDVAAASLRRDPGDKLTKYLAEKHNIFSFAIVSVRIPSDTVVYRFDHNDARNGEVFEAVERKALPPLPTIDASAPNGDLIRCVAALRRSPFASTAMAIGVDTEDESRPAVVVYDNGDGSEKARRGEVIFTAKDTYLNPLDLDRSHGAESQVALPEGRHYYSSYCSLRSYDDEKTFIPSCIGSFMFTKEERADLSRATSMTIDASKRIAKDEAMPVLERAVRDLKEGIKANFDFNPRSRSAYNIGIYNDVVSSCSPVASFAGLKEFSDYLRANANDVK